MTTVTIESGVPLSEARICAIDVQTTGASPSLGRLLEIGWHFSDQTEPTAHLVAAPDDTPIPARILRLTGLSAPDLALAADEPMISERLATALNAHPCAVVAHFARFEARFLEDLWQRRGLRREPLLPILCTHALARRLWPDLPSTTLRAVSGFVGHPLLAERRAGPHAVATLAIWRQAVPALKSIGVVTWADLTAWLAEREKPASRRRRLYPMQREKRLELPATPGIYRMLAADGRVLYVGKATSLQTRVNSYFRKQRGHTGLIFEMLSQAVDLAVTPCATALEAAMLETDEIKRLSPPYNSALKANQRQAGWYNRDLAPTASDGDARYGPFSPPEALQPLLALYLALHDFDDDLLLVRSLLWRDAPEAALKEGLTIFAQTLGKGASAGLRPLLCKGITLARAARRAAAEASDAVDDDDSESDAKDNSPEEPMTADQVAAALFSSLRGAGHAFLRARALRRLADATVAFRSEPSLPWRWCTLSEGVIVDRGDITDPTVLARQLSGVRPSTFRDIATYDRLRVLHTELQQISAAGGEVRIATAARSGAT